MSKVKVKIEDGRKYLLKEIVDLGLIPGVKSTTLAYNLVTRLERQKDGTRKRVIWDKTHQYGLKATHDGKPWSKHAGALSVTGTEIKKFLKINGLL